MIGKGAVIAGGAKLSRFSVRSLFKVLTNRRGFGFFVIMLNFLKGVLSKFDDAWAAKSPWPIVEEAGLRIAANDKVIVDGVARIKAFQGVETTKLEVMGAYYDTYLGLFTFMIIFLLIFFLLRGYIGSGNSVVIPLGLTIVGMFLVELVVLQAMVIRGIIPEVVYPLSGILEIIRNYKIVLPF